MSARIIYLLSLYSERLNTSTAKVLTNILDDVLPAFENPPQDGMIKVRIPKAYEALKQRDLLQAVNAEDLKRRLLARGTRKQGRPRKTWVKP